MSGELKTILIAMSPLVELRGAIPIAVNTYKLSYWSSYILSVLGNLVPLSLILLLLDPISQWLAKRSKFFGRVFSWLYSYSRKKNESKIQKFGKEMGIIILTATPIPLVGGWTGAIAAAVFGLNFKKSFPLIFLGTIIGGGIVLVLTILGKSIFGHA